MALGGKQDVLLSHAVNTAEAVRELQAALDATCDSGKHPGSRALLEAELDLTEVAKTGGSRRVIQGAFAKAVTSASNLLEEAPLELFPKIADIYDAAVPALREMGQHDTADVLSDAAGKIKDAVC